MDPSIQSLAHRDHSGEEEALEAPPRSLRRRRRLRTHARPIHSDRVDTRAIHRALVLSLQQHRHYLQVANTDDKMIRKPQAGDWAADDDDNDVEIAPIRMPQQPASANQSATNTNSSSSARGATNSSSNNNSRQEKSEAEPPRNRWGRTPDEVQAGGRRAVMSDSRSDFSRSTSSSSAYDRDARRDNDRYGGGRDTYERRDGDRYSRNDSGGYGSRSDDRYGSRNDDRYGGRNDDRYGGREPRRQQVEAPLEQGVVVAIKESFGFVRYAWIALIDPMALAHTACACEWDATSCVDRDGDLFFHITEAPVDVQVHDEVEFRVRFNQRSSKEVASQLVILPKGTIVMEDVRALVWRLPHQETRRLTNGVACVCVSQVSDEFHDGVVTRGLRNSGPSHSDARSQRDEAHGLIEIAKPAAAASTDSDASAAAEATEAKPSGQFASRQQRNAVRFTLDSLRPTDSAQDESAQDASDAPPRRKKPVAPAYGDEVRFRIATHRKSGAKRAVELTVVVSAKAKLEQEIEAKLATMTRESGVVDKMKPGGGFIKCCDRLDDVYFPHHEIRASDGDAASPDDAPGSGDDSAAVRKASKRPTLHEGDEVSFFVYEERDDESSRSRPRLTALRVQKLPKGSVSFEDVVRSDVAGVVSKTPKEPRNGPEVIGSITPAESGTSESAEASEASATTDADVVAADSATPADKAAAKAKKSKESKKKTSKSAPAAVPFRLSDTRDMSYIPGVGDAVVFDEVVEKRSGKHKAVNVRLVQLNPKNRERGVITSLRDDFGFIKCADRSTDAYFRFSDVMSSGPRDFRLGTEVAFDVSVDPTKGDNARATRVELLPPGSVQWETLVEDAIVGEVIALPGSASSGRNGSGGRGGNSKGSLKVASGRIRLTASAKKFWLDFLPDLKHKIDSKFVVPSDADAPAPASSVTVSAEGDSAAGAGAETDKAEKKKAKEIKLLFPASLANAERFVIHQYCDALALQHQSAGDGASRRLELVASGKVPALTPAAIDALPALEVEFRAEDLAEVRYSPRIGDRVQFSLVQATRTKQLLCKSVVCLEAVGGSAPGAKAGAAKSAAAPLRGEGFIVLVRNEGFGFIQPAALAASGAGSGNMDDNLFFHIKEVTTGETLEALKPGMEVQYTPTFDDVKKKTRALNIAVVPPGTIKKVEPQVLKGVVTRPSFLQPLKGGKSSRFAKASGKAQAISTLGKIRATTGVDSDSSAVAVDDGDDSNGDNGADDGDDTTAQDEKHSEAASNESPDAPKKAAKAAQKKLKAKAPAPQLYAYNIKDIVDPSVVLREGDEVEFTAVPSAKGPRASKIRVLALHAKQGVVTKVLEDFSGVIRVDSSDGATDAAALEIPFAARHVLRGDVLAEGDRVEFAISTVQSTATRKIGTAAAAAAKAEAESAADAQEQAPCVATPEEKQQTDDAPKSTSQATSVLRLSAAAASTGANADTRARAPRVVNSSLLQAMRQVGATAVVASRMAKGPDGTRGFKAGWRTEQLASATSDAAAAVPAASE